MGSLQIPWFSHWQFFVHDLIMSKLGFSHVLVWGWGNRWTCGFVWKYCPQMAISMGNIDQLAEIVWIFCMDFWVTIVSMKSMSSEIRCPKSVSKSPQTGPQRPVSIDFESTKVRCDGVETQIWKKHVVKNETCVVSRCFKDVKMFSNTHLKPCFCSRSCIQFPRFEKTAGDVTFSAHAWPRMNSWHPGG